MEDVPITAECITVRPTAVFAVTSSSQRIGVRDDRQASASCGLHEQRRAVLRTRFRVGACGDQPPHRFDVSALCGHQQRRELRVSPLKAAAVAQIFLGRGPLRVGARLEQRHDARPFLRA